MFFLGFYSSKTILFQTPYSFISIETDLYPFTMRL